MKKFINISFGLGLAIWFLTSVYLSVNTLFSIFIDTDPYIAKTIFGFSFLYMVVIGTINLINGGDFTKMGNDLQRLKQQNLKGPNTKKIGCKTCKQR